MELVKYNNNSISSVTALASLSAGGLNLLATNTISSGVSSSSFTSNIDSTYDTYLFKFINIHPSENGRHLRFQGSSNGGSSFGVTITSTSFGAYHNESGSDTDFSYRTGRDLAQSTSYQNLVSDTGNGNDESNSGTLLLFSHSSTVFVKHFMYVGNSYHQSDYSNEEFVAGYFNTTSAINAVDFKFSSGNIDSGVIKMYGLSKS